MVCFLTYKLNRLFNKSFNNAVLFNSSESFAVLEENCKAVAACNTEVGLLRFSGAVNNAAHNGNVDLLALCVNGSGCLAELFRKIDKVDSCSAAGGAGDYVDALGNKAERLENFLSCKNLADGVCGKGNSKSIADTVAKKASDLSVIFNYKRS